MRDPTCEQCRDVSSGDCGNHGPLVTCLAPSAASPRQVRTELELLREHETLRAENARLSRELGEARAQVKAITETAVEAAFDRDMLRDQLARLYTERDTARDENARLGRILHEVGLVLKTEIEPEYYDPDLHPADLIAKRLARVLHCQMDDAHARIARLRAALVAAKALIGGCKTYGPDDTLCYKYASAMLPVDTHHDLDAPAGQTTGGASDALRAQADATNKGADRAKET